MIEARQQSRLQIGVELTGHCDLRCRHCLREDLSTVNEFDVDLFRSLAKQARTFGPTHFGFTGGEITLHPRFFEFLDILRENGLTAHIVTNGNSYPRLREQFVQYKDVLTALCLSLDGATEQVHDSLRGRGSYRKTMMAIALASYDGFRINVQAAIGRKNRHQLGEFVDVLEPLGVQVLFFAHVQPTARASKNELPLEPLEVKAVDEEIAELGKKTQRLVLARSAGYYDVTPFAHCDTLKHLSYNIDVHGRMTFCCQLSGVEGHPSDADVMADLRKVPLVDAIQEHIAFSSKLVQERFRDYLASPDDPSKNLHCNYCLGRFGKLAHLPPRPGLKRLDVVR
ncbi:MAG: radical SAM protein [Polyangiales bacterium]